MSAGDNNSVPQAIETFSASEMCDFVFLNKYMLEYNITRGQLFINITNQTDSFAIFDRS